MRRTRPKSTDPARRRARRAAVRSVAVSTLLQLLGALGLLYLRRLGLGGWLSTLALVLAGIDLLTIPFAFTVLRQRLREIDRGELEEARKY